MQGSFFGTESCKYEGEPIRKLLKTYFQDIKLSQLLTDVAIPACNLTQSCMTTYFTRPSALSHIRKDFRVLDVALATSAAPTYFPSQKIVVDYETFRGYNGTTPIVHEFADGGIQVNNPTSFARKHAIELGNSSEYVHVLSLGSSDCIQNFMEPSSIQGLLFWPDKLPK